MGPLVREVCCLARARGFAGILLGTEKAPRADKETDKKKADGSYIINRSRKKREEKTQAGKWHSYINLSYPCFC